MLKRNVYYYDKTIDITDKVILFLKDKEIRELFIPEICIKFNLEVDGKDLFKCDIFPDWLKKRHNSNGGLLGNYINDELRKKIGKPRKDWIIADYKTAFTYFEDIKEFLIYQLKSFCF